VSFNLGANIENLITGIGAADGLTLTGNSGSNTIDNTNGGGTSTLDGGAGADILIGSASDDVFIVDNAGDSITSNGGSDTILASTTWDLSVNSGGITNVTLTGSSNIHAFGTGGDDTLTGNSGNNSLVGGGGNDTLDGMGGNDTMIGGLGDDIYYVDSTQDRITENAGEGSDTVYVSGANYTLGNNLESLYLDGGSINGTGNAAANYLAVLSGFTTNTLDGGAGADIMENLGANNSVTFIVDNAGDVVTGSATGTDTVLSSVNFTLGANVDNLTLTGSALNGTGNTLSNNITGNAKDNVLDDGGAGGSDNLDGGAGNDTYVVHNSGDFITDVKGTDLVQSDVSFDLSTNGTTVENITLLGSANINATGNNLNNVITGNDGQNTLLGLGGNDTIIGGLDNDILDGGIGKDKLTGGAGADTFHFSGAVTAKNADTITDFTSGVGNDVLDVSDLLSGYTGTVEDFVHIYQKGANTIVQVDTDGLANGTHWVTIATLSNVNIGDNEALLVTNGNLVVT
jgi:Ca2+-binding RTX toxin-like protein